MAKDNATQWYYGWWLWSIAALFYAYEFVHRITPSILTAHLRLSFSINEEQLALIGAFYFYAYAPFQLLSGVLIDKFGVRRILIIASSLLTVASFLFTSTENIYIAYLSRFLIGTGSSFAFVGCLKVGSEWLTTRSFPLVIGLTNLSGTIGALCAGAPLSYLIATVGWREVFFQLSLAGLFITILLFLFLKDKPALVPASSSPTTATLAQHPLFSGLALIMKNQQSWIIGLYGALLVIPIASLPEMWGVEYLQIAYHYPPQKAATITHTIFIGTALGGPLIGWLVQASPFRETKIMTFSTAGALILLTLFLYWPHLHAVQLYGILFCYGFLTANMLLCFDIICRIHPSWSRGAAIGFVNMLVMALGGLGQHSVGWLLNQFRLQHEGLSLLSDYQMALSMLPCCLVLAIFLTFFMRYDKYE